ncbi:MAG: cobalt-precorrin-5B (C(1))-methyltransferase CbiD [Lentisphaeria bacterium]|jgi:cobalt-precorrin-5B (C1)-methyltransferase
MTRLRTGFTTGAYAAATAVAAWRCLHGRRPAARVALAFPDGRVRRVNVDGARRLEGPGATAWATKDAGDDIDITNHAVIRTQLRPATAAELRPEDHLEACAGATLAIRAGAGVGRVSRPGLDVPAGKWAVNPGPRRMIVENLARAGLARAPQLWLAEIGIDNGEALAAKTLNPTLGVVGGLSILGSSGIVVPCSNRAYIRTIEILLRGARREGCREAVLVTGGRTHAAARQAYPALPEVAFIRFGDFIRDTLQLAAEAGFTKVVVCSMPGKLAKYALELANTHAHQVALAVPELLERLVAGGLPPPAAAACQAARSVRECLARLDAADAAAAIRILTRQARQTLAAWAPGLEIEIKTLSSEDATWLN